MSQPDEREKFKAYPIGYQQVDFAALRIETGKQYVFAAVDRTSKAAIAELHPAATQAIAAAFLRRVQA